MSLTSADIAHLVAELLDQYRYESVAPSTTFGAPWTAEKEAGYVELLKQCLVLPRLESFVLAETYEQVTAGMRDRAEYGVVAESADDVEWYDPNANEFGLGQTSPDGVGFISIGVRGDLVGVFCAM